MKNWRFLLLVLTVAGCKTPFNPQVTSVSGHYLVVEGIINSGNDSTIIKLSRTVKLSQKTTSNPELRALVTVESENGGSFPLSELGNGVYAAGPLNLDLAKRCRLHIKVFDGREYISDFDIVKSSPDIDSITYKVQNNGIQFYINSHDPQSNTRYYRWNFDETWKYVSLYRSNYKMVGGYPTYRVFYNSDDNIYECYKTEQSKQILLGSSAKLSQDVISMLPFDFVNAESGKISFGYSILLRQYALTANAFNYWQDLKKNTEQLGSIFDAQPSLVSGNIHCTTNPAEPVIGYMSASSVKSKRIFVDHYNINLYTPAYLPPPDMAGCPSGYIPIAPLSSYDDRLSKIFSTGDTVLIDAVQPRGAPAIIGYTYAAKECVDCRVKTPYGTNTKPSYWPY
jgi:hypothetical protein